MSIKSDDLIKAKTDSLNDEYHQLIQQNKPTVVPANNEKNGGENDLLNVNGRILLPVQQQQTAAPSPNKKSIYMQITMSILANITVLSSGMGLGYSAITLHALTAKDDPMALTNEEASWFASINSFACPFGGLLSAYFLDRIGRKMTLIMINVFSIVSWGLIAVSNTTDKDVMYAQLLAARILIGVTTGLSSSPAAVYSAEIASPKLRGRLTLLTSLSIAIGILMIYTLGYFIPKDFRLVSGIACVVSVCSMLVLIPLLESPSWLISKRKEKAAEQSLRKLRGFGGVEGKIDEIEAEMETLKENINARSRNGKQSFIKILKQPQIYKPLGIIIGFFGFQQFSGIFVIVVYAAHFSTEAGVNLDPFLCTVLIGITRVVATISVAYILDTLGRKPPTIFSGIGMTICMFGLAICAWIPPIEELNWLPAFFILTYIFTSTIGFLTIPFAMLPELFPQHVRGLAAGMTIFSAYLMSFIIIKLYPTMLYLMGNAFIFVFYGVVSIFGILYVYFIVPETKGKSLKEIEDYFKGETVVSGETRQV